MRGLGRFVTRSFKFPQVPADVGTVRVLRRGVSILQLAVFAAALVVAAALPTHGGWEHPDLFLLLLTLSVLSETFPIETKNVGISGSFPALIIAMAVLGPGPAVAIGVISSLFIDLTKSRPPLHRFINNLCAYAVFPILGALMFSGLGYTHDDHGAAFGFAAAVFVVFLATNFLNFLLIVAPISVIERFELLPKIRSIYVPVIPVEIAAGLLTAAIAYGYQLIGIGAVAISGIVGFVFVYLVRINISATERGEQLEVRTRELASLQVGLISSMLKTLALRDHMTARHSAAVARYSRAMAKEIGLPEREVDLIHTAALFHDIGKFIFPDSILLSDRRLTDEEYDIVKRHPAVGADVISEIDGYGPVADVVRYHHERIDGRGYPTGISGDAIPVGSRIIAVADVYDVITARDTYRTPVSVEAALVELRRVAGTQLDAHLVDVFCDLVARNEIEFRHGDDADFEAELQFERRVREYAQPQPMAA
jgi:putative nucleotidyltransferase with HDIG domain